MQRTKLGISVGLLGAAVYLMAFLGGWVPLLLLVGYVLLVEQNEWLRKAAVKAAVLTVLFALTAAVLRLLPDVVSLIDSFAQIFEGYVSVPVISKIVSALCGCLNLAEKVLFILLGVKALRQGNINLGFVDKLVNKFTPAQQ